MLWRCAGTSVLLLFSSRRRPWQTEQTAGFDEHQLFLKERPRRSLLQPRIADSCNSILPTLAFVSLWIRWQMERTVDIDENQRVLKELHIFGADPARTPVRRSEEGRGGGSGTPIALEARGTPLGFEGMVAQGGNALGTFGLELADSDDDEDDEDGEGEEGEVEEGEI